MRKLRPVATTFVGAVLTWGHCCRSRTGLAATLLVDDDNAQCPTASYSTISAAVAARAGRHHPSVRRQLQRKRHHQLALQVLGPNAGIAWDGVRQAEAVVTSPATTFNLVDGQNVTINGFTITGDFGIYVSVDLRYFDSGQHHDGRDAGAHSDSPGSNARVLGKRPDLERAFPSRERRPVHQHESQRETASQGQPQALGSSSRGLFPIQSPALSSRTTTFCIWRTSPRTSRTDGEREHVRCRHAGSLDYRSISTTRR